MTQELASKSAAAMGYANGITFSVDVSDLHKSIAWYQEVLGLELDYVMEEIGWCELKSPVAGVSIGLSQVEKVNVGNTTPVFAVNNIEATHAYLESQGVQFRGAIQTIEGMVKLATFYDPDGNSYMLSEGITS